MSSHLHILCCGCVSHPRQPDSKWSWLVCAAGSFAWALGFGTINSYAVVMPAIMNKFRSSREATGTMNQSIIQSFNQSTMQSVSRSANQSINQPIN